MDSMGKSCYFSGDTVQMAWLDQCVQLSCVGVFCETMQTSGLGQPLQLSTSSHPRVPVSSPSCLSLPLFLHDMSSQASLGQLLISQPQRNWDFYMVIGHSPTAVTI